ncbi:MAG: hypothetical protein OXC60_00525, partial [Litoreibacter sp.]|nr:hypothetical protein [Litoreibacter sp.]
MRAVKSLVKFLIGRAVALTHPKLAKEVLAGDMLGPQAKLKRLISGAEFIRLNKRGEGVKVQQALSRRWTSENLSVGYYDKFSDRFDQMFSGSPRYTTHGEIAFDFGLESAR